MLNNIERPHWSELKIRNDKIKNGYIPLDRHENLDDIYRKQINDIITNNIDLNMACQYIDYYDTYQAFANFYNITTDNILITGGCDEAIRLSCEAILNKNNKLLHINPTYRGIIYNSQDLTQFRILTTTNKEHMEYHVKIINPAMFYICTPNNPLGEVIEADFIEHLLITYPNTVIFIDNAYDDFTDEKYDHLIKYQNVLIGKSFSKAWGLSGSRIGLLLGHKHLIQYITKIRPIMSVSSISLQLIKYLLENNSIVQDTIKRNKEGIHYMIEFFKAYSEPTINVVTFPYSKEVDDILQKNKVLFDIDDQNITLTALPKNQFIKLYNDL